VLWQAGGIRTTVGVHNEEGWCAMSAKSDQVKGHVKEAAGVVSGDKDLESEGKTDRRTGEAEEKIDHAKDKVEEVVDKTKDALQRK
jgi:uncharacterized protein YjbJ (UPF0337 family)